MTSKQAAACIFVQYCWSQRQRPISACIRLEQQMQTQEIVSVSWLAYWPWVGVCLCVSSLWLDTEQISKFFLSSTKALLSMSVLKAKSESELFCRTPRENPLYCFCIQSGRIAPQPMTKNLSCLICKKFVWTDFDLKILLCWTFVYFGMFLQHYISFGAKFSEAHISPFGYFY